jgi:hypothetical protein
VNELERRLAAYDQSRKITLSKGKLCVTLVTSRKARMDGLPLRSSEMLTDAKGQVAGLGKAAVQSILKEYGEMRVLAEEGGRTSRGSIGCMESYVAFLNELHAAGLADMDRIEQWWVGRVRKYFEGKPFKLKVDHSKSIKAIINDLLGQAQKRQQKVHGATCVGAMYQHLVGAALDLVLGDGVLKHHGFSVADASTQRAGDFIIDDVAIHVTTSPTEALIRKCVSNIEDGLRAIIITSKVGTAAAEVLCANAQLQGRVDVFEIEQFIASNIYEMSGFSRVFHKSKIRELVAAYNEIVETCETDPSLRIELAS